MFEDLLREIDSTQEERRSATGPEQTPDQTIIEEVKARRFKVTLTNGRVLLHSRPGGLTRQEAIALSTDWGEVAECVPVLTQEVIKPVSLDLTLAAATAGLPITVDQFHSFLSQEDLADIGAGFIPVETLRAYAGVFSKQLPPPPVAALVRCADCAHFERLDHPHTGRCAQEHGRHWLWDTDRRVCEDFGAASAGEDLS